MHHHGKPRPVLLDSAYGRSLRQAQWDALSAALASLVSTSGTLRDYERAARKRR